MGGFQALSFVVGAPRRLSIDGDEIVPARPKGGGPALETRAEQERIDPVHKRAHPTGARSAMIEWREVAQEIEMMFAPGGNVIEIIAGRFRFTSARIQRAQGVP